MGDILDVAILVGNFQGGQDGSVFGDFGHHAVLVAKGEEFDFTSVFELSVIRHCGFLAGLRTGVRSVLVFVASTSGEEETDEGERGDCIFHWSNAFERADKMRGLWSMGYWLIVVRDPT